MFQLISVVITIALFAWLLMAGIGYLNPDAITREGGVAKIRLAVSSYQAGLVTYQYANGKRANALSDVVPSLVPASQLPVGYTVASYDKVDHELCFSGTAIEEAGYDIALKFVEGQSAGSSWVSGTCFATVAATEWSAPTAFPAPIAVTITLGGL